MQDGVNRSRECEGYDEKRDDCVLFLCSCVFPLDRSSNWAFFFFFFTHNSHFSPCVRVVNYFSCQISRRVFFFDKENDRFAWTLGNAIRSFSSFLFIQERNYLPTPPFPMACTMQDLRNSLRPSGTNTFLLFHASWDMHFFLLGDLTPTPPSLFIVTVESRRRGDERPEKKKWEGKSKKEKDGRVV